MHNTTTTLKSDTLLVIASDLYAEYPWRTLYPDGSGSYVRQGWVNVLVQMYPNITQIARKSGRQVYLLAK